MKRTPLYPVHVAAGAKMVDFAGWEMPIQYTSIKQEHLAVRAAGGLFDVSHMGQIDIVGPDAEAWLRSLVTNDVTRLTPGRAQYALMCDESGGVIDDLIVYRLSGTKFLVICNASNRTPVVQWMQAHVATASVKVRDVSDDFALIAVQGPAALATVAEVLGEDAIPEKRFTFELVVREKVEIFVARTGYTGEDGCELLIPASEAVRLWEDLMAAGKSRGVVPVGLGARDTLRIEAALPLYGHEIDRETTPFAANLGFAVKLDAGTFVGQEALRKDAAAPQWQQVGLRLVERGVPREGCKVVLDGKEVGSVSSGTFSPSLNAGIALARIRPGTPQSGLSIVIRDKAVAADVVKLPFVKKV